jgi:alpha-L-rhamnosidase
VDAHGRLPQADPERDVEVSVTAADDQVTRGDSATGTLTIDNFSPLAATDVTIEVSGDSLDFAKDEFSVDQLGGDSSTTVDLEAEVAPDSPMGPRDVDVVVSFTAGGKQYSVNEKLPWVTVVSGVDLDQVKADALADPDGLTATRITAVVKNSGGHPVSGRLVAARAGWTTTASEPVTIPAGGSAPVSAIATPRGHLVTPSTTVDVAFVDDDVELARDTARVAVSLTTPPAESVDHVDFGDTASEGAHAIQASSSSGTSSEAGLTRRYAHSQFPGSWFSAAVDVPRGQAFALRLRETFDGAKTKEFTLYADDVLVGRYEVPRTDGGNGWLAHQIIVDSDEVMAQTGDGTVRLKFEFPTDAAAGHFDPSIADAWIVEVPDADGPAVEAEISQAGDDGWHGAGAALTLSSQDGATIRYRIGAGGWTDYATAVPLAEGTATIQLQARATDGTLGPIGTLAPKIDATTPASSASVDRERAVTITGEDLLSGVASIEYRLDEGDWQAYGKPVVLDDSAHRIGYRATDRAGNTSSVKTLDVTAAPIPVPGPAPRATTAPTISGTTQVGRVLRTTDGTWDQQGVTHTRQWLRNGRPVAGATASTYRVRTADVGARITVMVTAAKPGHTTGSATSARTRAIRAAVSRTRVTVDRRTLSPGQRLRVTTQVTAPGLSPTGRVDIYYRGKKVRTVTLRKGKITTAFRPTVRGKHALKIVYRGSRGIDGSRREITIRIR